MQMVTPSKMKGRKPVKIPVHSVMDVLAEIHELGHSDNFRKAAKEKDAFVTIHPQTVNFVKDYLAENNLHTKSAVARDVVGGCPPGDPYKCPYTSED